MQVLVIIIFAISLLLLVIQIVRSHITLNRIIKEFMTGNVIVSGRKSFGKDILFQTVINKRKDTYFGNISYGGDYNYIEPKELELSPNDYKNFIEGKVIPVQKNSKLEKHDVYFSDGGVIFPSQMDSTLHKLYPSLPISYALSRHLWNNSIHVNTQRLERVWKALREQADYFVLLRKKPLKLPFFMVLFTTEYTRYESAKQELSPMGSRLFNKYSKAEKDKYKALHGDIKNGIVIVPKWKLYYDTRAFHKVLFGEEAPRKEENLCVKLWKKLKQHFKKTK